jgi:hypothetical protein
MDRADIINALRELCRGEDFKGSESTSLLIMREYRSARPEMKPKTEVLSTSTELALLVDGLIINTINTNTNTLCAQLTLNFCRQV